MRNENCDINSCFCFAKLTLGFSATFSGFLKAGHCQSYFVPASIRDSSVPSESQEPNCSHSHVEVDCLCEVKDDVRRKQTVGEYQRRLMERVRYGMVCLLHR